MYEHSLAGKGVARRGQEKGAWKGEGQGRREGKWSGRESVWRRSQDEGPGISATQVCKQQIAYPNKDLPSPIKKYLIMHIGVYVAEAPPAQRIRACLIGSGRYI